MSNYLITAIQFLLVSAVSAFLYKVYADLTNNTKKRSFHNKARPVVLAVSILIVMCVLVRIVEVEVHFLSEYAMWPLNLFFAAIMFNVAMILSTVFNQQSRYRITEIRKHRVSIILGRVLMVLFDFLLMIGRFLFWAIKSIVLSKLGISGRKRRPAAGMPGNRQGANGYNGYLSAEERGKQQMGERF